MEFLRSFLRRCFAGKPLVASRDVVCFLRLAVWITDETMHLAFDVFSLG